MVGLDDVVGGALFLEGAVAAELAMEDVEGYWRRAAPAAALLATLDEELPMVVIRPYICTEFTFFKMTKTGVEGKMVCRWTSTKTSLFID